MCEEYRVAAVILKVQLCSMRHQQIDHLRVTIPGSQHETRHATPGQKENCRKSMHSCVYRFAEFQSSSWVKSKSNQVQFNTRFNY